MARFSWININWFQRNGLLARRLWIFSVTIRYDKMFSVAGSLMIAIVIYCMEPKNKWSSNFDERPHRTSCRYWWLNDPFCCVRGSRDSQCFSVARTTPKNCLPLPAGWSRPHLIHGSFSRPNCMSFGSAVFAGLTNVTNRQTDRQTTLLCL